METMSELRTVKEIIFGVKLRAIFLPQQLQDKFYFTVDILGGVTHTEHLAPTKPVPLICKGFLPEQLKEKDRWKGNG